MAEAIADAVQGLWDDRGGRGASGGSGKDATDPNARSTSSTTRPALSAGSPVSFPQLPGRPCRAAGALTACAFASQVRSHLHRAAGYRGRASLLPGDQARRCPAQGHAGDAARKSFRACFPVVGRTHERPRHSSGDLRRDDRRQERDQPALLRSGSATTCRTTISMGRCPSLPPSRSEIHAAMARRSWRSIVGGRRMHASCTSATSLAVSARLPRGLWLARHHRADLMEEWFAL